jgi:hypothetical protein
VCSAHAGPLANPCTAYPSPPPTPPNHQVVHSVGAWCVLRARSLVGGCGVQLAAANDELSRLTRAGSGGGAAASGLGSPRPLMQDAAAAVGGTDAERARYFSRVAKQLEAELEQVGLLRPACAQRGSGHTLASRVRRAELLCGRRFVSTCVFCLCAARWQRMGNALAACRGVASGPQPLPPSGRGDQSIISLSHRIDLPPPPCQSR